MIRCNNCGWFNLDSAKRCEMCDEELTGLPIENPSLTDEESDPEEEKPCAADPVPDPNPVESGTMMKTVRLEKDVKVDVPAPSMTQTVLDASVVLASEEPVECPKCRYPVFGYAETCPNCGASLKSAMSEKHPVQDVPSLTIKEDVRISDPAPADAHQSKLLKGTVWEMAAAHAVSSANSARETVREIPKELISNMEEHDFDWCLIPVESPDSETIYMRSGEIIRIGNRSYKFQKR